MNALLRLTLSSLLVLPLSAQDGKDKPQKPAGDKPADTKLELGKRVNGEMTLLDLDGKPAKAQDQMGKITVVNFFSIQCPIQKDWDGRLAEIQKEFGDRATFLHINSNVTEIGSEPPAANGDEKPYQKVRAHLEEKKLPFRVLVDHGNKVADLFDAKTTPHIYVFGRDGRLVYKGLVDDDQKNRNPEGRTNYLRDVLTKLASGEKVEPFATKEQGCTIKRIKADGDGAKGERRKRETSED